MDSGESDRICLSLCRVALLFPEMVKRRFRKPITGYRGIMQLYSLELIRRATRKKGIAGLFGTAFKIIRSRLFGRWRLVYGLEPAEMQSAGKSDYKIVYLSSLDMVDGALRDEFKAHERYIWWDAEDMFKEGACLWLGYMDGKLASITWTRTGDKVKLYFFPMTAGCAVISHSVTFPEYRGHGLLPAMLIEVINTLAGKGIGRFYIDCWDWNESSKSMIERAGFSLIGRGRCVGKDRVVWYPQSSQAFTKIHDGDKM